MYLREAGWPGGHGYISLHLKMLHSPDTPDLEGHVDLRGQDDHDPLGQGPDLKGHTEQADTGNSSVALLLSSSLNVSENHTVPLVSNSSSTTHKSSRMNTESSISKSDSSTAMVSPSSSDSFTRKEGTLRITSAVNLSLKSSSLVSSASSLHSASSAVSPTSQPPVSPSKLLVLLQKISTDPKSPEQSAVTTVKTDSSTSNLVSPLPVPLSRTTSPPRKRRTTSRLRHIQKDQNNNVEVIDKATDKPQQLIIPIFKKPKQAGPKKPFSGVYQWREPPKADDEDDKRSRLLILPLLAMFLFLFASIGRCINWCTEDVRLADYKLKHGGEEVVRIKSHNGSVRSGYSYAGTPPHGAMPSPLLQRQTSGRSMRSTRSLRTPERRRRPPATPVNLSADDVRQLDQRPRRPPALASRTASGSALQRQISNSSLRRQVHLDRNKVQWGVQFEKRRRDSDASSSGIATAHGSTSKIKFDVSPSPQKEVSSPSSLGYVSHSESFADGAALLLSAVKPSPLVEKAPRQLPVPGSGRINSSDLNLARALLQLQRLSLGVTMNMGCETVSIKSESACSTAVSSPPVDENDPSHPFLSQRRHFPDPVDAVFDADKDDYQSSLLDGDDKTCELTQENVASMSSSSGCDDLTAPTPSTSTAGDESPSTVTAPTIQSNHRSDTLLEEEFYVEDPIILAVKQMNSISHKRLQRMTSDDEALCHSSGLSSKHSSYCSEDGDSRPSSVWASFDQCQSPSSSTSSGVNGNLLYTIATIHTPPATTRDLSPNESHNGKRPRHQPRRRRDNRNNSGSLAAVRQLQSKDLLQKISKISQPGYPGKKRNRPPLNQCHSWCGPGSMETHARTDAWRRSLATEREYFF